MDLKQTKAAVEAMLFAHAEPVTAQRLAAVLEVEEDVVSRLLHALRDEYESEERGIMLLMLEDRWQLATKPAYGAYIKTILDTRRNAPLSPAAMETLAVIAYNQPVSRSFIEQVRGVDSASPVQTLLQKGLIEEAGRLDLPGRPIAFATTDVFLRTFGLASLAQLPPLHTEAQQAGEPQAGTQQAEAQQEEKAPAGTQQTEVPPAEDPQTETQQAKAQQAGELPEEEQQAEALSEEELQAEAPPADAVKEE